MSKKLKVGVDIDGVIWDLINPWIDRFNQLTDSNIKTKDIKSYNIESYIKKNDVNSLYSILNLRYFWNGVEPYKDTEYWLKKFNQEFNLYIVTSTKYKTLIEKFNRFFALFPFLNEEQLITCYKKSLINLDYMVDDYEKNLQFGNFKKILFNQPYNLNFPNEQYDIKRVNNLQEAYELIKEGH